MSAIPSKPNPLHLLLAFASGGLLTLMVDFNGTVGLYGSPFYSSWVAHGTGTVAAVVFLLLLRFRAVEADGSIKPAAPLWAYLGGGSGALTVILTSEAVNSPLALSGTLALGLAGQVVFSLAADRWGLFGMPKRVPGAREFGALALIALGSFILIFGRG